MKLVSESNFVQVGIIQNKYVFETIGICQNASSGYIHWERYFLTFDISGWVFS